MDREEDGQGGASGKRARGKGVKGTGDAGATHAAEGLYHLCVAACSSSVFFFFFVYVVEANAARNWTRSSSACAALFAQGRVLVC